MQKASERVITEADVWALEERLGELTLQETRIKTCFAGINQILRDCKPPLTEGAVLSFCQLPSVLRSFGNIIVDLRGKLQDALARSEQLQRELAATSQDSAELSERLASVQAELQAQQRVNRDLALERETIGLDLEVKTRAIERAQGDLVEVHSVIAAESSVVDIKALRAQVHDLKEAVIALQSADYVLDSRYQGAFAAHQEALARQAERSAVRETLLAEADARARAFAEVAAVSTASAATSSSAKPS